MSIKVSVIVPCYNVEQFLPRCLDSLVNQTLKDIEIICVNDASPDNGIAILRDYEARYDNIVVIDLKENVCLGGARNRGLDIARGEYITFVDSDDWVETDMLEKLYTKASVTGADLVSCNNVVREQDRIIRYRKRNSEAFCGIITEEIRDDFYLTIRASWGYLILRDLIQEYNMRFPEHMAYEDIPFNLALGLHTSHYEHVNEYLYNYRANANSITRKRNAPYIYDRPKTFQIALDYYKQHVTDIHKHAHLLNYMMAIIYVVAAQMYLSSFDHPHMQFLIELSKAYRKNYIPTRGINPFMEREEMNRKTRMLAPLLRYTPRLYFSMWWVKQHIKRRKLSN